MTFSKIRAFRFWIADFSFRNRETRVRFLVWKLIVKKKNVILKKKPFLIYIKYSKFYFLNENKIRNNISFLGNLYLHFSVGINNNVFNGRIWSITLIYPFKVKGKIKKMEKLFCKIFLWCKIIALKSDRKNILKTHKTYFFCIF